MICTKRPLTIAQINEYNSVALAYLGDAVYEQQIRLKLITDMNILAGKLHGYAVKRACAEYQCRAARILMEENFLTDEEQTVLKRGRNASSKAAPKHATAIEYRMATGLESLFGYLFLKGEDNRIEEIFNRIWDIEP